MPDSSETLGGRATPPRPTATKFNLVMTALLLVALPSLVYYMWICLQFFDGKFVRPAAGFLKLIPTPNVTSASIVGGWLVFQMFLQIAAPGRRVEGAPLPGGSRLTYKINGWISWWFTWACVLAGVAVGRIPPTVLADQFGPLLTTANLFAFAFSLSLYRHGSRRGASHERVTHNWITDFWLGTARNPRIGRFDLKLFFEGRPGVIGWVAIDLSLAAKQYQRLGTVTAPMILICLFHFWYVADYFFHEEAILTTWDVKHENLGFMLCWGNLVWVPFIYTTQAFYLVNHSPELGGWAIASLALLNFVGFAIFRGANIQKHVFRRNPERAVWGRPARYIQTARGSLLLTSGWWGLARHMNYFGDWLMGLAWCLTTGFSSVVPYFYIAYFTVLLVHRERRDNEMCAVHYGEDWQAYCRTVPWRIVPGVY